MHNRPLPFTTSPAPSRLTLEVLVHALHLLFHFVNRLLRFIGSPEIRNPQHQSYASICRIHAIDAPFATPLVAEPTGNAARFSHHVGLSRA